MSWSAHVVVASIVERNGKFLLVEEETLLKSPLSNPKYHNSTPKSRLLLLQVTVQVEHTRESKFPLQF